MTDTVKHLVAESGYPNMKVLEFAFDERDTGNASDYLPHNYPNNCVVYTGTHDNETLISWLDNITPSERRQVREYLNDFHSSRTELGAKNNLPCNAECRKFLYLFLCRITWDLIILQESEPAIYPWEKLEVEISTWSVSVRRLQEYMKELALRYGRQ